MTESNKLDQVYVINVKKFTERRVYMECQLAKAGLQADFILDWDVDELTDEIVAQYFSEKQQLSDVQKSCALKHIVLMRKIAATDSRFNLILEDDAVFGKDFTVGLQRALDQSALFAGEKVIYIGSGGNFYTPKSQRIPGRYLYHANRGRFTDSYIIDSATARKRLQWISLNKISNPIDNQFDLIDKEMGIQILWFEDPIVEQGSKNGLFKSAIETRWSTRKPKLQGLLFRVEKIKRKYFYQLWR